MNATNKLPHSFFMNNTTTHFIRPVFNQIYSGNLNFEPYISFVEGILKEMMDEEVLAPLIEVNDSASARGALIQLNQDLPYFHCNLPEKAPSALAFTLLCTASFTHGVGRYVSDCLSRWLIPGKFFPLPAVHSLSFQFLADPEQNFFVHQVILQLENDHELSVIKNNLPSLIKEMRLNILAVKHARNIMTIKKLSHEQKSAIIQENIETIIDRPSKEFDTTIYDHMQHFLLKLSAEEKIGQIKDTFATFIEQNPNIFDRDIYTEIKHFVLLFREPFTGVRLLRHVGRIISYQYIYRKILQKQLKTAPKERHLLIKLLKTQLHLPKTIKSVVGILIGLNVLSDHERFGKLHILTALEHSLPAIKIVKDSFVADQRNHDKVRLFYLEIEKEDNSAFNLDDIKNLRKKLGHELKGQFENVIHPVFMPRNDEEILRNILLLANQLKYVKDIPQVVISFDAQSEEDISFTIILLRLLQPSKAVLLKEELEKSHTFLKFHDFEIKHVGHLRNKYIKEANVFKVHLNKKTFLRKDYSLDLFKARQAVYSELSSIIGEMRDFNGGILSKQHEIFHELKQLLLEDGHKDDFLLESFFYSINPPLMRSIFSPSILKSIFLMLVECEKHSFKGDIYKVSHKLEENYLLVVIGSENGTFKEKVLSSIGTLKIPSSHLASAFVDVYEVSCLGFIVRPADEPGIRLFLEKIHEALTEWSTGILANSL